SQELQSEFYGFEGYGTYVLPIAQRNDGRETILRVANLREGGGLTNGTLTFSGSGEQGLAGESAVEDLQPWAAGVASAGAAARVPGEWVGSVFITSGADSGVVADRDKVDDQMLLNNTSRPELTGGDENLISATVKYGALVFQEYNFWNTGISVAN